MDTCWPSEEKFQDRGKRTQTRLPHGKRKRRSGCSLFLPCRPLELPRSLFPGGRTWWLLEEGKVCLITTSRCSVQKSDSGALPVHSLSPAPFKHPWCLATNGTCSVRMWRVCWSITLTLRLSSPVARSTHACTRIVKTVLSPSTKWLHQSHRHGRNSSPIHWTPWPSGSRQ